METPSFFTSCEELIQLKSVRANDEFRIPHDNTLITKLQSTHTKQFLFHITSDPPCNALEVFYTSNRPNLLSNLIIQTQRFGLILTNFVKIKELCPLSFVKCYLEGHLLDRFVYCKHKWFAYFSFEHPCLVQNVRV